MYAYALIFLTKEQLIIVRINTKPLSQKKKNIYIYTHTHTYIYRVSQEEWTKLRDSVPYVKLYRYNPKHLYPKLNSYGDNGQRSLKL